MANYISSNANRWYCAIEGAYGQVPGITAQNRFPAVKMTTKNQLAIAERKDKTGSRTFAGHPVGAKRSTQFDLESYMTSWSDQGNPPAHGPLFQCGMGGVPQMSSGGTATAGTTAQTVVFSAAHGLSVDQAVTFNGEIRFVMAIVNANTVALNAAFSTVPASGSAFGPTATYTLGSVLPSATVFDYWSPSSTVHRILSGSAIDTLSIEVNGDYHEFKFSGIAQDIIDSSSFVPGSGKLGDFPAEPTVAPFNYNVIPGHMGQAWLGAGANEFVSVTGATIQLQNNLETRNREFGFALPQAIVPGKRTVSLDLSLYGLDDAATQGLYQAARQQSPISSMFQLGQAAGQLFGVYMKSVVPEVPEFDDSEQRLQWHFRNSRAQGTSDDELVVAFA